MEIFTSNETCCRPLIFQNMKYDRSNIQSFKYQEFPTSGCKTKGIRKVAFAASNPILLIDAFVQLILCI